MLDLTNHEFAVLLLADEGESLIPIGIWEKPIKTLTTLGLLKKNDGANYVITEAGHAARIARDENDGAELSRLLSRGKEADEGRAQDATFYLHDGEDVYISDKHKVGLDDE